MESGSIAAADNLPAHKVVGIRQCLEAAGMGLLYLPPYSPDLNPIEMAFAKLKTLLRRMTLRSFNAICDAIKTILENSARANVQTISDMPVMCRYDRI